MTSKTPTDAAIIKALQEYEKAMNVALSLLRTAPEKAAIFADDDEDTFMLVAETSARDLYRAHRAFHSIALAAQRRIDAKKESKK